MMVSGSKTFFVGLVGLVAIAGPACSSTSTQGCAAPLDQFSCAATFELQVRGGGCNALAGTCGAYKLWRTAANYIGDECIYDTTGEHLVSADQCEDVQGLCEMTSSCIYGGQAIEPVGLCDFSQVVPTCSSPDGGPDGAGASD